MLNDGLHTVVLWNPSAGSAKGAGAVLDQLQRSPDIEVRLPDSREAAIEQTMDAIANGARQIVAAGGDGSVSLVVEGIMRSGGNPELGILPLGTGNDLARTLQIPLDPSEALRLLSAGQCVDIDVAEFTSARERRWYVNMLTGGNTGLYMSRLTDEVKQRWGPFCYLRGLVDLLQDLQVFRVIVTCDDSPPEVYDALNVFVANGRNSGGGLAVSPEAEVDDGFLDVVIVQDGDPGEIAGLTSQYVVADYLQHELIAFRRTRQITIESDPPMPLTADGDEVGCTPLSVTARPRRLRIIVPRIGPR